MTARRSSKRQSDLVAHGTHNADGRRRQYGPGTRGYRTQHVQRTYTDLVLAASVLQRAYDLGADAYVDAHGYWRTDAGRRVEVGHRRVAGITRTQRSIVIANSNKPEHSYGGTVRLRDDVYTQIDGESKITISATVRSERSLARALPKQTRR